MSSLQPLLLTLSAHAREGYSTQFVCLSVSVCPSTADLEDRGVFTFGHQREATIEVCWGGGACVFFPGGFGKKIITNSHSMFICQNVGNLKGFLLVYLHGLYLIIPSSYSSTGRGTSYSNNKKNKIKYLSIQLLIRGTCRGATELWNNHREFPYLTSLFF